VVDAPGSAVPDAELAYSLQGAAPSHVDPEDLTITLAAAP
jgi:hypothetical protein